MNYPVNCPAVISINVLNWVPKSLISVFVPNYKHLIVCIEPETEHFVNCIKDKWMDDNVHFTTNIGATLDDFAPTEICIAAFRKDKIIACINKWLRGKHESPELVCNVVEF